MEVDPGMMQSIFRFLENEPCFTSEVDVGMVSGVGMMLEATCIHHESVIVTRDPVI